MKLGIMQPYFFPYLGYYSLIKNTDKFILFDVVQFIRHGWIERNRILKPGEGWQYIAVPLEKSGRDTKISEVKIRNSEDWRGKLFRQIEHYKKAPFYKPTIALMEQALDIDTDSIVVLNANILRKTCEYLGISLNLEIFGDMNVTIDEVTHPGEWALNISKALNASAYYNPTGGIEIFDRQQFKDADISLKFIGNNLREYSQRRPVFENGLSIVDVLMFNDVEQANILINDIKFVD